MTEFVSRRDWTPDALRALSGASHLHFSMESLLWESFRRAPATGVFAEFGVHQGGTLRFIASANPGRWVYGFDSFRGLPEDWDANNRKGDFDLGGKIPEGLPGNVECVAGWFDETLPGFFAARGESLAFAHVDSDLYSSAVTVLRHAVLLPGAVLNFHEFWHHPTQQRGEALALAEWLNETGRPVAAVGRCGEAYSQAAFVVQ